MIIKKIILIIIIANIGLLKAQYTAIPDFCFENILIETGIDTEGTLDGQVLTADITNVIGLDLGYFGPNCDVLDASGIEDFTNLELLFIGRSITTIDLSNNLQLKEITALQGNLQNINIVNCSELTYLAIVDNPLTSINISTNTNLETLILIGTNELTSIDLTNNTKIKHLSLGENQLTALDINSITDLEFLDCHSNFITSLTITNLSKLTNIYASSNLISEINFTNLPNVTVISLSTNNLSNVNLSNLPSLQTLNVSENQLEALDVRNGNNSNFTNFNATNNPNLTCIFVDDVDYSTTNWLDIDQNSTFVETETECEALAIIDFSLNNISIYPNPTKDILFIENPNTINIEFIKIYNMLGQQVLVKKENFNQINLTTLKPAIYLVNIKTKNGIINTKIVKK